jgi:hypothetical protein
MRKRAATLMNVLLVALYSLLSGTVVLAAPLAPTALSCLARHYPVKVAFENDSWVLRLASGSNVLYDDRKEKTFEQRLESPDVQDAFFQKYSTGPIAPVNTENHDPGRIRITALLDATYGNPPANSTLVRVSFLGQPLRVHKALSLPLQRIQAKLIVALKKDPKLQRYLQRFSGAYNRRLIAGTDRISAHAYGIAIDLDASLGDYWRWSRVKGWQNQIPQPIVDAFESEGFIWGGRWYHYDTLHFEYRPELLDESCWSSR